MSPSTRAGRWVRQQTGPEGYAAFVPAPLPPRPALAFSPELLRLSDAAGRALGRLEGISTSLDPDRLVYLYVRKEAVLSSSIEGTRSTLSDLLRYETDGDPGTPLDDVREVSRYVAALQRLVGLNIAAETSGCQRDRLYPYTRQLQILDRGTGR